MQDHDVQKLGSHLDGKKIALLITSGIAAYKTPSLVRHYRQYGAEVHVYATPASLELVARKALEWCSLNPVVAELSHRAEHLFSFDAYVVAPATSNTIAKLAHGIADNAVTATLCSALGRLEAGESPILVAPAMHGSMMNSVFRENLERLVSKGIAVIAPDLKWGKANLPDAHAIVVQTIRAVSKSPLKGKKILVTAGPTPGWIDNVRMITNKFRGRTGIAIAEEAYLRGADVKLILGSAGNRAPRYIDTREIRSYQEYYDSVLAELSGRKYDYGIFSAAVADYIPAETRQGKIPSRAGLSEVKLRETAKVIEVVRKVHPELFMVTFKYQEGISHEELERIALERAKRYQLVVANRGEDMQGLHHRSFVCNAAGKLAECSTKEELAVKLMGLLEAK